MTLDSFVTSEIRNFPDLFKYNNFEDSKTAVIANLFFNWTAGWHSIDDLRFILNSTDKVTPLDKTFFNEKNNKLPEYILNNPAFVATFQETSLIAKIIKEKINLPDDWVGPVFNVYQKCRDTVLDRITELKTEWMTIDQSDYTAQYKMISTIDGFFASKWFNALKKKENKEINKGVSHRMF